MTHPIQELTDEHGRIRAMLLCFEAQLDRFERAERPDYEILEGSITYCQEYLDRWHHPREDALLDLLRRRARTAAQACAAVEEQHRSLARITGEMVKTFEAVERDAEYPRARLVKQGRTLVRDYRRHLDWEEARFFPALLGHLLSEDWRETELAFANATDPLTANPVDQRYRVLFDALFAQLPER